MSTGVSIVGDWDHPNPFRFLPVNIPIHGLGVADFSKIHLGGGQEPSILYVQIFIFSIALVLTFRSSPDVHNHILPLTKLLTNLQAEQ